MTRVDDETIRPIGTVRGGRVEPFDDDWAAVQAEIVLDERFDASSVAGLGDFSHLEVVYRFHLVGEDDVVLGARRPRGRADWPEVGILAQRGRVRPNRIGVAVCTLLDVAGTRLLVQGLDAVDGTPVLDVKPYLSGFAPRGEIREPAWAGAIMATYW